MPAEVLTVEASASDTFPATGKRVEETAAKGTVRFRNVDFTSANTIPGGSIVSAAGGIRFRTNQSVTVGAATLVGLQIVPKTASVGVTAVEPGPEGNVEPNTILTIPRGESPVTLSVTNPEATTGGTREEFPKVTQADVDKALAALDVSLQASFAEQVADPSLAPEGSTVFPETASLGESTPIRGPGDAGRRRGPHLRSGRQCDRHGHGRGRRAGRLDRRVPIARQRRGQGSQLVEDSITVDVGEAVVTGGVVSFPVTASATQVALLDPAELEALVLGKTPDEATVDPRAVWHGRDRPVAGLGHDDPDVREPRGADHRRWPGRIARGEPQPVSGLLGVDLGEKRIGIAVAEDATSPARPLVTLRRGRDVEVDAAALQPLIATYDVDELVVGLPLEAAGQEGTQAALTRAWTAAILPILAVRVTLRDERLTSHLAETRLGPMKRGRSGGPPTKTQRDAYRARVDREAAAIILQDELDTRAGRRASMTRTPDPQETS